MSFWSEFFVDGVKHVAKKTLDEQTYKKASTIMTIFSIIFMIALISGIIFILKVMNGGEPLIWFPN